jgi:2-isopropylmalate synthase
MNFQKYKPKFLLDLPERTWTSRRLQKAPIWCSVDLRDGNQALIEPMNIQEKLLFYKKLLAIGFREIEIGFPSAASMEYDFTRLLIEEKKIPDEVAIQVLCQARPELIDTTIESIRGAKRAIFHLYNSTSSLQRKVVFKKNKAEITKIAVDGTNYVKEQIKKIPDTQIIYQYSPESFTQTEPQYALEICEAVIDAWQPSSQQKMIINLPATVETTTANVYADVIEWFLNHLKNREHIILSLHTHNDRGTAVAATELALMAGADRVEGTLFGNGERTGNVDLVTLALNLFSQGVNPELDFSSINEVRDLVMQCNKLPIGERHPYVGELVYTAFSGSHQDAISKGMKALEKEKSPFWDVPYLPIDPKDLGRHYEPVRINSQSGKGGVSFILEQKYNFRIPRKLSIEFSKIVQRVSEETQKEVQPAKIKELFLKTYEKNTPVKLESFQLTHKKEKVFCSIEIKDQAEKRKKENSGNGAIDAFVNCIKSLFGLSFVTTDYQEHTLSFGSNAKSICYYEITLEEKFSYYGVGIHSDIVQASFLAIISSINRHFTKK